MGLELLKGKLEIGEENWNEELGTNTGLKDLTKRKIGKELTGYSLDPSPSFGGGGAAAVLKV